MLDERIEEAVRTLENPDLAAFREAFETPAEAIFFRAFTTSRFFSSFS